MLQIFSSPPVRRKRTVFNMDEGKGLLSLADGEGQARNAEFASVLATRRMERCLEEAWSDKRGWYWPISWGKEPSHIDRPLIKSILIYARKVAHEYLKEFKKRHSEWHQIRAGVTTSILVDNRLFTSQTGANRVYLFTENDLRCISCDATDAMFGAFPSKLDAATEEAVAMKSLFIEKELVPHDVVLFCSKGVGVLTYQEIYQTLSTYQTSAQVCADELIHAVKKKQPIDDAAVIIVRLLKGGA